MANKSFQPTRPSVTALAGARPAPVVLAAEADVRAIGESEIMTVAIASLLVAFGGLVLCLLVLKQKTVSIERAISTACTGVQRYRAELKNEGSPEGCIWLAVTVWVAMVAGGVVAWHWLQDNPMYAAIAACVLVIIGVFALLMCFYEQDEDIVVLPPIWALLIGLIVFFLWLPKAVLGAIAGVLGYINKKPHGAVARVAFVVAVVSVGLAIWQLAGDMSWG